MLKRWLEQNNHKNMYWETKGHMLILREKELRYMCLSTLDTFKGHEEPMEKPVCEFWKETPDAALPPQRGKYLFKLLFYGSYRDGTFQTLKPRFKGTCCTWICVGVSFFFYTARLNMNMFQSTAKHRGETRQTEKSVMSEIYHPLIKTFLKTDTSVDITYLSSPSCCYPSHVQIKTTL